MLRTSDSITSLKTDLSNLIENSFGSSRTEGFSGGSLSDNEDNVFDCPAKVVQGASATPDDPATTENIISVPPSPKLEKSVYENVFDTSDPPSKLENSHIVVEVGEHVQGDPKRL